MVISVHVHKTAGRSFNEVLKSLYGPQLHRVHYDKSLTAPTLLKESLGLKCPPPPENIEVSESCQCIHGHFKASRFIKQFPDAQLAIWLRDPLQRAASHYYFLRRESLWIYKPAIALIPLNWGLKLYLSASPHGNLYSRVLDGIDIEQFAFVGLSEQYDSGIELFCKVFNLQPPAQKHQINVNPDRRGNPYAIPEPLVREFSKSQAKDIEIYRKAQERFRQLCSQHQISPS